MSTRANIIRDKGRPPKGANAEERRCLIFFSLVVRLIAVQLSLVPPMERYETYFLHNHFFVVCKILKSALAGSFLFSGKNLTLEHIPQKRRIWA